VGATGRDTPYDRNPFTTTEEYIWKVLGEHADFSALVKPNNRVKFYDRRGREPRKDSLQNPGDLPEVAVAPAAGSSNPTGRTTAGNTKTMQWEVTIVTGEHQTETLFDVAWATWRALEKLDDQTYIQEHLKFIRKIDFLGFNAALVEDDPRVPGGWVGVFTLEVMYVFPKEVLNR
jgi:hypothetical protein